jgi:hypothetical protein
MNLNKDLVEVSKGLVEVSKGSVEVGGISKCGMDV